MDLFRPVPLPNVEMSGRLQFSDPDVEAAYRHQKFIDTRFIVVLVGFAAAFLAVGLWAWDWAIDPSSAVRVLWLRLLLGAILLVYPVAILAGFPQKFLGPLFAVLVLAAETVFLHLLSRLDSGVVYGIAGFMYWFMLPVFLGLSLPARINGVCFILFALLPNMLVPLGMSPDFELIKYNALIWPTCAMGIFITLLLDQLYRRVFIYRRKVETLASIDDLTGIANRRHFMEISARVLESSRRHGTPVSLIMFDIDHFKPINDNYGHPIGDQVLRHVADILKKSLRKSDFPARYGGEEFAVILPQTMPEKSFIAAEKVRKKIMAEPLILDNEAIHMRVSAGATGASVVSDNMTLEHLIKKADDALYQAKRRGRNQVVLDFG